MKVWKVVVHNGVVVAAYEKGHGKTYCDGYFTIEAASRRDAVIEARRLVDQGAYKWHKSWTEKKPGMALK